MKGQNVCSWLPLGFYKVCVRSCIGKYCGDHLVCLRKGSRGWKACVKCRIGVKSKIGLCGHDRWALPIGKGRTGWLQHSSSLPVSQLLKYNVPAACLRNFDRESYRTNHYRKHHTPFRPFFRTCASVYEKERATLAVYTR